jgi:hypothetical protein
MSTFSFVSFQKFGRSRFPNRREGSANERKDESALL